MPRKSNSVSMYGKQWGPIDIKNLEKAIQLYERLNELQKNFADSLSGSDKIMKQINERTDIQNELKETGIKLSEDEAKTVLIALTKQKEQNEELDKKNEKIKQTNKNLKASPNINSVIDRIGIGEQPTKLSGSNFGSTITNAVIQRKLNDNYKYFKDNSIARNPQTIAKLAENKTANDLKDSASKYSKASNVLQIAADTFMSAVKTFGGMFTEGKNKQVNTYENTFTGIAARTGYSRSEYYTQQAQTNNQLGDLGLRDNIRTSEVQQMWSTLTSEGLSIEDSIANAFDTVISSKVVPYLNTSTAQFQFLVDQQPNLMTQVRGIGRTTMEISGSATFATKYLQDMIDTIAPMASLAENELGLQFAQVSGAYESLRAKGLNDAQIGEMYKASASVYNNPYQALKSGSLDEKMAVANVIQTGGDLRDFSDVNSSMMSSQNFVANLVPEGNLSPLYSGLLVSEGKLSGTTALGVALNEGNYDMQQAIADGIKASDMVDDMGNKVTEEFRNGDYQTNKERQAITMENLSNELATMQQFMGGWYDVIVTAIKGVAGMIAATVVGKGIGALAGSAAGGAGVGLLGTLASGAAIVGLTTAAIYGIGKATRGEFDSMTERTSNNLLEEWSNSEDKNVSKWGSNKGMSLAIAGTDTSNEQGWLKESFSNVYGGFRTWGANWFNSDYIERNKEFWGWLNSSGTFSEDETNGTIQRIAAYYLWDKAGSLDSIEGVSKSDLQQIAKEGWNLKAIQSAADALVDNGWAPSNKEKVKVDSKIDFASYGAPEGSYRQGLDYVPKDNYPALLHQGEAVLTASTANELRTLVDEYRSTNKESISFETIIQNQTSSLISKMDEMLQVMRSFTGTTTTDWRNGFITNSMKYVKSTKSFS